MESLPAKQAGFRLALRLAGMTMVENHRYLPQAAGSRFHCGSGILPLKGVCGTRALDPKNVQPPDSRFRGNDGMNSH